MTTQGTTSLIGKKITFVSWGHEHYGRVLSVLAHPWMEPHEYQLVVAVPTEEGSQNYTVYTNQVVPSEVEPQCESVCICGGCRV